MLDYGTLDAPHSALGGRCEMGFRRLCKAAESLGKVDNCPAVYAGDDPLSMIVQGKILDPATLAMLISMAADETAVRIPTETLLRAVGVLLSERGRPELAAEIEEVLAEIEAVAVPA